MVAAGPIGNWPHAASAVNLRLFKSGVFIADYGTLLRDVAGVSSSCNHPDRGGWCRLIVARLEPRLQAGHQPGLARTDLPQDSGQFLGLEAVNEDGLYGERPGTPLRRPLPNPKPIIRMPEYHTS